MIWLLTLGVMLLGLSDAVAQRQMERLGRGVAAFRRAGGDVYVGWRLLGTDPADISFNLYRSVNSAVATKLNAAPLTNTTDYVDGMVNLTATNAYFVKPVLGGVEQAASAAFILPANSSARQYLSIPMRPIPDGDPYQCFHVQVGDVDGDGEFELVCLRRYIGPAAPAFRSLKLDCYRLDGTFLWRVDSGTNYTDIANDSAYFTVIDLDGDGRSEVAMHASKGTVFGDGTRIASVSEDYSITNYNGYVISGREFLSVLDGATGKELARTDYQPAQTADPYGVWGANQRPWYLWMAAGYLDGVHASIITQRGIGGDTHKVYAWDFQRGAGGTNGAITQRWSWSPTPGGGMGVSHNLLIYDVNNDGKDEIVNIGGVIGANGALLYENGLVHGDHFRVTDMDPDRPGPEFFAIQQNNPNLVGMGLYDAVTGKPIKVFYMPQIGDLSRGDAGDYDGGYRGVEFFSTMSGMFDCKGNQINANHQFPSWGIWWDADLQREIMTGADADGTSSVINKWYPASGSDGRLYSIYSEGVHQDYGGWPLAWGDYLGDWREETIQEADTYDEIRVYSTTIPATNRIYTLMQNAAYRVGNLCKGRIGASFTDYYLGGGMAPPTPPAFSDARLIWRGGAGANTWDAGITANWATNWFWLTNSWSTNVPATTFAAGQTLLFDATGSNSTPILLSGTLSPGNIKVHSPGDYTFAGAGSLAGSMKLTKAGPGKLTINTTNTYTNATLICEGPVIVNGSLNNSPVTVRGGLSLSGRIGGNGRVGQSVSVETGGGVSPGNGRGSAGTLTATNCVTLLGGAINDFDLSDDPAGATKTNDLLTIVGSLSLAGTNTIAINLLNTNLSPGTYTLIRYSGSLTGGITNLVFTGLPGVPATVTNPPGAIALVVRSTRLPASIVWGGPGSLWDLSASSNWFRGGLRDIFVARDTVRFDSTGSASPAVSLVSSLPVGGVVVDAAGNYSFSGSGSISGAGGLTKTNSGTLTIRTINDYTGPTVIGGGTIEAATIDTAGSPSSLGASGGSPTNLVFFGGTLRYLGAMASTDHGGTLNGSGATIDVAGDGGTLVMTSPLIGGGGLTKNGPGTLTLNAANTYTGGTFINSGTLQLGTETANVSGLGSGPVTLNGGSLGMINIQGSETAAWNLVVPTNATAGLAVDGRCSLAGALTGGGTLYISIPYVRSDFKGNWSAFTGWMDISGSNFRCGNSAGYPKARLHFNSGASLQNRVSGTPTIPIGELSGDAGSAIVAPGGNDGIDAIWRVGGLNSSATFDGTIANGVGLIKEGSGSWTLAGNNTYTRGTTVNGGTLLVNNTAGSGTGSGAVTVASGGALGGSGSIAGAVTVAAGGKLVPSGTLTVSNHLTLSGTSISQFELGTVNDRVVVAGNLTLAGLLNITNSGDFFSSTNILFAYSGTLSGAGLTLGAVLPYFSYTISTNTPGVVRLTALSTVPAPLAPATLAATASNAVVLLNWSPSANTLSYHVNRSSVSGGPYTDIAVGVTGTNYADLTVTNGYAYYYAVSASNGSGQSGTSPEAGAAPPGTVPDAPTGLSAVAGNQLVALNWIASTFATSYTVKRSTTNGGPYTNVVTGLTAPGYYDTGLTSGRAYYYVVSGVNINGESAISAQASATPFLVPAAYWTNRITGSAQSWNLNGNWTNAAAFPNGVSAVAVMNADITATQTNNLSHDVTLGALSIGDANSSSAYNLSGNGGSLIFDNNGIPASLAQLSTSKGDTISAPIVLNDALVISNLSANTLALAGDISGATNGIRVNGNVNLSGANAFTGGLTIGPGSRVYPGSIAANSGAWGTGPITLQGGTVQFNGYGGSVGTGWGGCTNTINVPAGQIGTLLLPPRWGYSSPFASPLVGGGTLNVTVDYIRDYFSGDWSDFTGQINIYTRSGSGDFRINNPNGYAGAAIYLAGSARFGCIYNSTQTIEIGELAGDAGTLFGTCDSPAGTQTWRVGGRHTSATYAGTVTDGAHAANIVKLGAGTWTLTGSNTYSGTTTISGGILQIGAGGTSGSLASATIVNNATLAFNRADDLTYAGNISGTGSLTKLGAGALTLTGANTYYGLTRVSGGTLVLTDGGLAASTSGYALNSGAVLDGRSLTGSLALISGQTLTGNGSILGSVAVGDGAILSPGDPMGVLTFSGVLSFAPLATTVMEVSKLPLTNDQVSAQTVVYGGRLQVILGGTAPLTGGEVFKLFSPGTRSGGFANISLPSLAQGLVWNTTRLYGEGTVSVSSTNPPQIGSLTLVGTSLVLSGSGGTPGGTYYVLASTNITWPAAQWSRIATNQFDVGGGFSTTLPGDSTSPERYYLLQLP